MTCPQYFAAQDCAMSPSHGIVPNIPETPRDCPESTYSSSQESRNAALTIIKRSASRFTRQLGWTKLLLDDQDTSDGLQVVVDNMIEALRVLQDQLKQEGQAKPQTGPDDDSFTMVSATASGPASPAVDNDDDDDALETGSWVDVAPDEKDDRAENAKNSTPHHTHDYPWGPPPQQRGDAASRLYPCRTCGGPRPVGYRTTCAGGHTYQAAWAALGPSRQNEPEHQGVHPALIMARQRAAWRDDDTKINENKNNKNNNNGDKAPPLIFNVNSTSTSTSTSRSRSTPGIYTDDTGLAICGTCHGTGHAERDCPEDEGLQEVLRIARGHGWQRCGGCGMVIEMVVGCNHLTCRCGYQFCYQCGKKWKSCGCEYWEEDRLIRCATFETFPEI